MKNDELFDFGFYVEEDNSSPSLRKANVYLLRGEYEEALKIYQELLDNDINNIDAYIGILRVHSKDYTVFDNDDVVKDIYVIRKYYKDAKIEDIEYLDFIKRYDAYEVEKENKLIELQKEIDFEQSQLKKMELEYANLKKKNELYLQEYHREKEKKKQDALKTKELEAKKKQEKAKKEKKNEKETIVKNKKQNETDEGLHENEEVLSKPKEEIKKYAKIEVTKNVVTKVLSDEKVIVIRDGITKINQDAFKECKNITELHLPNSILEFSIAFDLDSLYYDGTVEDWCNKIKWSGFCLDNVKKLFFKNKQVTTLIIPSSVKKIRKAAFSGLILNKLSFSEGLITIGEEAFANTKVIDTVVLPYSLEEIDGYAFEYADISKITLSQHIKKIGEHAFSSSKIQEVSGFEHTKVEKIERKTFSDMYNLKNIQLPETLVSIEDGAFENCSSLVYLRLPKSVNMVGDKAFYGCYDLTLSLRIRKPLFSEFPKFFSKTWRGDSSYPKVEYNK